MKPSAHEQQTPNWKKKITVLLITFSILFGSFLFLLHEGIKIISATQAFTAANSQWMLSQKDAVNYLYNYLHTRDVEDYDQFQSSINQVYAIRNAIDELRREDPDFDLVREGLIGLQVSEQLINSMIAVRRYLGSVERFTATHALWEECNIKITHIDILARSLHQQIGSEELTQSELFETLAQIRHADESLTEEAQNILLQLDNSSNWLTNRVLLIIGITGFALVVFALSIGFYWFKMTRLLERTVRKVDHLSTFPELNPIPVIEVSFNGEVTYRNPYAQKIFPDLESVDHPFLNQMQQCLDRLGENMPQTTHTEVEINNKVYDQIIHRVNSLNVFHIYALDVTDRKSYEMEIKRSLQEKEVLLAEIHHRVKNNLAVIAGLLELEVDSLENDAFNQIMRRNISRIHSIALVHEKLYEFQDFSNINFKTYIEELVRTIHTTYHTSEIPIELNFDLQEIKLNVNQAVPLAIIINEVITNAYKHAFKISEKGEIDIVMVQLNGEVMVRIRDNGVGLPESFDIDYTTSLGMTLINTLAKQIDGKVLLQSGNGTSFQITFQAAEVKGSVSAHLELQS